MAVGPEVRKGLPKKLMLGLTSKPGKFGWDTGKRLVEGAGESHAEGTTCSKVLSHLLSLTLADSHTKVLSPLFHIWLFKFLWGTHFAILNECTNMKC